MWPFSDFQYGFRSFWSTADLLTVVSDRIARAFNRSGATQAVELDIYKAFDRVWHAGLLHKLIQISQYPVNARVPQGSILHPTLFLLYINDLPDDFICNIAIYADDNTLYSISVIRYLICGNNLNWLLNLNLIYETLWSGVRSGLLISMLEKLSSFDWSTYL